MIPAPFLCQRNPDDHAVGGAGVLDLEHRPLAGLIRGVFRLGDHAVKAGAFEPLQPLDRRRCDRASSASGRAAAPPSSAAVRARSRRSRCGTVEDRLAVDREQIEGDERRGHASASFATRDAAGCRRSCSASKSSPSVRGDHDLAVEDAAGRKALEQRVVQLGEVAIERLQIAALNEDVVRRRGRRSIETRPTWVRTTGRSSSGMSSTSLASIGSIGGVSTHHPNLSRTLTTDDHGR